MLTKDEVSSFVVLSFSNSSKYLHPSSIYLSSFSFYFNSFVPFVHLEGAASYYYFTSFSHLIKLLFFYRSRTCIFRNKMIMKGKFQHNVFWQYVAMSFIKNFHFHLEKHNEKLSNEDLNGEHMKSSCSNHRRVLSISKLCEAYTETRLLPTSLSLHQKFDNCFCLCC